MLLLYVFLSIFLGNMIPASEAAPIGVAPTVSPSPTLPAQLILNAQNIVNDRSLGLIIARGDVDVSYNGQNLWADTLTYNQKLDMVTASGNVRLKDTKGNVAFSPYLELKEGWKEGVIKEIKILSTDDSRFVAVKGHRHDSTITILEKAAYTPCKRCDVDPNQPLTWHITADKITLDETAGDVDYQNAWLYMLDAPVLMVPYLTHPTPNIKRRSGFLSPSVRVNNSWGVGTGIPYFVSLSPSQDLTIEPFFFTKELPLLSMSYRQRFSEGSFQGEGSFIKPDRVQSLKKTFPSSTTASKMSSRPRWHGRVQSEYHLNSFWRVGMKGNRVSDKTYYPNFSFLGDKHETVLESKAYVEGFYGNNYLGLQGYSFQNMAQGMPRRLTPHGVPRAQMSLRSDQGNWREQWSFDMDSIAVNRRQGINTQRVSGRGGISLPVIAASGQEFHFKALVQSDTYHSAFHHTSTPVTLSQVPKLGSTSRLFPKVSLGWRYPWINSSLEHSYSYIIEPQALLVLSPNDTQMGSRRGDYFYSKGRHQTFIPNEESRDFSEFDDTKILVDNRFPGFDKLDTGNRVDYGIQLLRTGQSASSLLVGQSYAFRPQGHFMKGSGLDKHSSDYVGRFVTNPMKNLTLNNRTRLDQHSFKVRWNEAGFSAGPEVLKITINYLYFGKQANTTVHQKYHMATNTLSSQMNKNWFAEVKVIRDLAENKQLSHGAGVRYRDDCFEAHTSVTHSFYEIPGVKPGLSFEIKLHYKNLGDVSYHKTLEKNPISPLDESLENQPQTL